MLVKLLTDTIKYLIGIAPNGTVSNLSDCYGGRATDVFIVKNYGFLEKILPQDQVMRDNGFQIQDMQVFINLLSLFLHQSIEIFK